MRALNSTGSQLVPGTLVSLDGWSTPDGLPTVILASRTVAEARAQLLVVSIVANGDVGVFYPCDQIVNGINVGAAGVGDGVYLGTNGGFAFTTAPAGRAERIGTVVTAGVTGSIYLWPSALQVLAATDAIADESVGVNQLIQPTTTLGQVTAAGLIPVRAHYDFALIGGAIGTKNLLQQVGSLGATPIAQGFMAFLYAINVTTPLTSGGAAQVALGLNTNTDLLIATDYDDIVDVNTLLTAPVLTTAARDLKLTISGAALTAGVFDLYALGVFTE